MRLQRRIPDGLVVARAAGHIGLALITTEEAPVQRISVLAGSRRVDDQ